MASVGTKVEGSSKSAGSATCSWPAGTGAVEWGTHTHAWSRARTHTHTQGGKGGRLPCEMEHAHTRVEKSTHTHAHTGRQGGAIALWLTKHAWGHRCGTPPEPGGLACFATAYGPGLLVVMVGSGSHWDIWYQSSSTQSQVWHARAPRCRASHLQLLLLLEHALHC